MLRLELVELQLVTHVEALQHVLVRCLRFLHVIGVFGTAQLN